MIFSLLTCEKTSDKRHIFSEKRLSSLWKSKQLNKPLIIRIMTMTFNILQGKFNLVFDFGAFSCFEIISNNKEENNRTKDKK